MPSPSRVDTFARAAVLRAGRRMAHGSIVVHEGDTQTVLGTGYPFLHITVHDPRFYAAVCHGSTGLGEAYQWGWWDCDNITELIQLLIRNLAPARRVLDRLGAAARPVIDPLARQRHTDKAADRRNIHAHYDIGNDFYALMLDSTMTYSCAMFQEPGQPLAEAQTAKLDRLCQKLALTPADHVVEIGSGWGSFAIHAASRYGCRVTTTTISEAQYDYTAKRVVDAGLTERVAVLDSHYQDLTGIYDKLVSIEMIEAVDWRDHQAFFAQCARLLRPDGIAAVQAIVIDDDSFERAKHHADFIRRHIFPGGCLPSISSIATCANRAGFRIVDLNEIGGHYPETLRRWRANFRRAEPVVADMGLGVEFRRIWDLYLAYCEAAFLEGHVNDVQLLLAKPARQDRSHSLAA